MIDAIIMFLFCLFGMFFGCIFGLFVKLLCRNSIKPNRTQEELMNEFMDNTQINENDVPYDEIDIPYDKFYSYNEDEDYQDSYDEESYNSLYEDNNYESEE